MNRKTFYDTIRGSKFFPVLSASQVGGMERLLDVWAQWYEERFPLAFLANGLSQIRRETGGRMTPVFETFSRDAATAARVLERDFNRGKMTWVKKRYWLPDANGIIWIGRGDIQITHKANSTKLRKEIKKTYGVDIDLDVNPEGALHPVTSAVIAFEGLTKGLFRTKKLGDFYDGETLDHRAARDVVNGDTKHVGKEIADCALLFEKALRAAGAEEGIGVSQPRLLPGMADTPTKPSEMPAPPPPAAKINEAVKQVQERLIDLGYGETVGKPDGIFGEKTERAIAAFEAANAIKLYHIDAATWAALMKK